MVKRKNKGRPNAETRKGTEDGKGAQSASTTPSLSLISVLPRQTPAPHQAAWDVSRSYLSRPAPSDRFPRTGVPPPRPTIQKQPYRTLPPVPSPARRPGSSRRRNLPAYSG